MVGDRQTRAAEIEPASAQPGHGLVQAEQAARRHRAQRDNRLRLDHGDLAQQERRAGFDLLALRRAVSRRAALHDVRDIHLLALQAHGLDHLVEQLPGASDERTPLLVFVRARAFADEHQLGVGIAFAEDDGLPSLACQHTARTLAQVFLDESQRLGTVGDCGLRLGRDKKLFGRGDAGGSRHGLRLLNGRDCNVSAIEIVNPQIAVILQAGG